MQGSEADPGVAPRAVSQLFDSLRQRMAGEDAENNDLLDSEGEEEKQEEPAEGEAQDNDEESDEEGKTLVR